MGGIYFWTDLEHICPGHSCPTHFARVQWCNCSNKAFNSKKEEEKKKECIYMPSLAPLAAKSAAKSQLMPTWLGIRTKNKQIKSLSHFKMKSKYSS